MTRACKSLLFHGGFLAVLFAAQFVLSDFHHGNLARIMVLSVFAMGYNVLFGYTGLLSLGHALFFAAGMYAMGLTTEFLGFGAVASILFAVVASAALSLVVGALALRTTGVAFMIVTLMLAQAGYLTVLHFGAYTRGDEGIVINDAARTLAGLDLADPTVRYFAGLLLLAVCMAATLRLVHSPFGHVLIAIRENEERARMLGYDVFRHKLGAVIVSGTLAGTAGAFYGLLFGYVGGTFATVQYSILPLLWVLLGGAGTVIGPFVGTLFMFYLIDFSSGLTSAYMLVAGVALVLLTLFAPQGLAGELRRRVMPWLP